MPVYGVTVTRFAQSTDTVLVQAENEEEAKSIAVSTAADIDFDTDEVQVDAISELSADEALEKASEVIT